MKVVQFSKQVMFVSLVMGFSMSSAAYAQEVAPSKTETFKAKVALNKKVADEEWAEIQKKAGGQPELNYRLAEIGLQRVNEVFNRVGMFNEQLRAQGGTDTEETKKLEADVETIKTKIAAELEEKTRESFMHYTERKQRAAEHVYEGIIKRLEIAEHLLKQQKLDASFLAVLKDMGSVTKLDSLCQTDAIKKDSVTGQELSEFKKREARSKALSAH